MTWDPRSLPDQSGKTVVVTGANAGVGYYISEQLARAGARVLLACRNKERAQSALIAIRGRVPGAKVDFVEFDSASLESVRRASASLAELDRIDVLIENAGITSPPGRRETTVDGNELIFGTNVLGHFALTAGAMPLLLRAPAARVVTMGSLATKLSSLRIDDLQLERGYGSWRAYAQSKIAIQSFGFELERRLGAAGSSVRSLVAHPGYAVGGLAPRIQGVNNPSRGERFADELQGVLGAQGKDAGAWPAVRAAVDPDARGGQFWGPRLLVRGTPTLQRPTATSIDPRVAARVWAQAADATGVDIEFD